MRSDEYRSAGKTVRRTELPGQPLEIYTWERTIRHRNKDCPTHVVQWVGLHTLQIGDREVVAERSTIADTGPVGTSVTYTEPPEKPPTQEERERTRETLKQLAVQAMYDQGLW